MAMWAAAACGLVSAAMAAPSQMVVSSHRLDVSDAFARTVLDSMSMRNGVARASQQELLASTGIMADVTVGSGHRQLQAPSASSSSAGLTITYSVHCGSRCDDIGKTMSILANNEDCGCAGRVCLDGNGNACRLTPRQNNVDWTPGSCVSPTGSCTYTSGQGVAHAQNLINAINIVAAGASFATGVVQSTAAQVAGSLVVPSTVHIPAFIIPPVTDCVGAFGPCDSNCTQYYAVTQPSSISYADQFGGVQPAGAPCAIAVGTTQQCAPGTDACPAPTSTPAPAPPAPPPCADSTCDGPLDPIFQTCDMAGYTGLGPCTSWGGALGAPCDAATLQTYGFTAVNSTAPAAISGVLAALLAACPAACGTCTATGR
jgi:hypothetical protein